MASDTAPTVIKKYANRRLYNTGTSTYVTLEDLAEMVKRGEDFTVSDAKSGEDITHPVLTQIIVEQESKGQNLLPVTFLRQLIRFYGDQMQAVVPSYLAFSMDRLSAEQQKLRDIMGKALGGDVFGVMHDQARVNMTMFQEAFRMFNPFAILASAADASARPAGPAGEKASPAVPPDDLDGLKREVEAMRARLDKIDRP